MAKQKVACRFRKLKNNDDRRWQKEEDSTG